MATNSGFPSLLPAFSISMQTTKQSASGKVFAGAWHSVGPISTGTITSEPGFGEVPLHGTFVNGADVIRICPKGTVAFLDFRSVIELSETEIMYFTFTGHIEGNQETLPTLRGHPTAKGYGWGSSYLSGSFETGCKKYQFLTNKIFVGSQRVVKNDEKHFAVEIKLSLVVDGKSGSSRI